MVPEIWSMTNTIFCNFEPFFAILPPNNPKNQKNEKKSPGDIIILHMGTINDNHIVMVPAIWSMENIIFCHFGPFFALIIKLNQNLLL